jgi:hypothetical protein
MLRRSFMMTLAGSCVAGLSACAAHNEGRAKSYRIESRTPHEAPALGSADLVVATDRVTGEIANLPDIRATAPNRTIIVMDRVDNRTSDPSANFQIYLARIRAMLNESGATRNLAFVETRARAEDIKRTEGISPAESARTRPRYALSGAFYDMPRGGTNYYLLTFQLVDLTNDIIALERSYEVKL